MTRTAKERRAENARQAKVAEIRAAEGRRRARLQLVFGAVGLVLLVVVVMVAVKVAGGNHQGGPSTTASSAVVRGATTVPVSVFDKVGAGTAQSPPQRINGQPSAPGTLPKVLYVGAEYCPYCAGERWAVAAALSRFGTFKGLGQTFSSSTDVFPSTATLSFHGSSYTSKYVQFNGYEQQDRSGNKLDAVPPKDLRILEKYDSPPFVPASSKGSIPFLYVDGKYVISGASYNVGLLQHMTHKAIVKSMADPNTDAGQAIVGTANLLTAAICATTNNKPGNVCTSAGVSAAAKKLAK
ncbi:MAG: DUF929 domain-containing protein [Actinomycetota bacterium]|nr:DUF929 domain-containing protein [Actinomycetota bacterium]